MSVNPILGTNYSNGDCQIKIALPAEGKYNYSVIIIPGEVTVLPSFLGNNEIRRPSEPPQHNCPLYVTEGEDIDCLCSTDNLGLPSGSVAWRGTDSLRFAIDKVNRTYSGTNNTCILMWNKTVVQSTLYTVTVNYASRVLSFKIDNKADDIVNVSDNANVSTVCQAEGRPLPTLRLFTRSSDNQDVELTAVINGLELQYTMSVKCGTTATYSCKSENEVSEDQRRILLTVSCAPRQTTQDIYSATFNGGEARLEFKIIAYPPPDDLSVFYIGSSLNDNTLRKVEYKNTLKFECTSDGVYRYMVTCTVTLLNETIFSTGVYHAVFSNSLGNISLTFEIKEQLHTTGQSKPEVAGQVAGGVIGAVVAIVLTASIAIFVIRRKRMRNDRGSRTTNPVMTSTTDPQNSLETLYSQLQREDVNSPSVYQSLGHQQTSSNITNHEDEGNSHVYEVPIDLQENTRETHHKETIYQNNTLF
ncbi:uncharacterized protein LOC112568097 [Pomacea canaliculata]|uniref:uncharacterized protein LOC112568097 n=1 Tax=Pomacea canaliculata TaxID=400727 RepID=UPI000D732BF8|nr:uncharacterized protein LOC112568097 [Pomacea canaliculata]